jgi:general secretion pathway protein E
VTDLIAQLKRVLAKRNLLVEEKFREWVGVAETSGQTLDRVLSQTGYLTERQMLEVFGEVLELPLVDKLVQYKVPARFLDSVPVQFARNHNLVAIGEANGGMRVATCAPLDTGPFDELTGMLDAVVEPVLATRAEITALINKAYQAKVDVVDEMLDGVEDQELEGLSKEVEKAQDLIDLAGKAPIIKLVNMMLFQALKMRASDVHIQPYEEKLQVRFRVDGSLYDVMAPPKKLQDAILSRVKIMGKMDIAERRLPQDGRATVKLGDADIDIRISSVPTSHGERIVMRLLDKSARLYELNELGMSPSDHLPLFKKMIASTHGIILVTGPTGSGKSTTLYAALKQLNSQDLNLLTIEDPIEYQLPGVNQIEVNVKKGLTFARGLRHILRQDPDIVMVGEIRDLETATIAIQAALTGHLVFSTLHTNDAPGAVTRLLDLGIEPYLVSSSVIGVIAQRLVRLVCKECREMVPAEEEALREIGLKLSDAKDGRIARGKGCPYCLNSGYMDRTAIYEIMMVDEPIREMVMKRTGSSTIKQHAIQRGMRTLRMDGARKVVLGVTTPQEVMWVTQMDVM